MTPEQFCYWLQGFGELSTEPPTAEQWKAINEHLALVFRKVTPPAPGDVLRKAGPDHRVAPNSPCPMDSLRGYKLPGQAMPNWLHPPYTITC